MSVNKNGRNKIKIRIIVMAKIVVIISLMAFIINLGYGQINNIEKKINKIAEQDEEITRLKTTIEKYKITKVDVEVIKLLNLTKAIDYLNGNVDPMIKEQIVKTVNVECTKVGIPPLLVLCLIKEESNFNPLAHNSLNATGLMQVIPKYHQDKIKENRWSKKEVFYIKNNIKLGTMILKQYFDEKGDIVSGLQKYVGALHKKKASQYIENIINNYITLQIKFQQED